MTCLKDCGLLERRSLNKIDKKLKSHSGLIEIRDLQNGGAISLKCLEIDRIYLNYIQMGRARWELMQNHEEIGKRKVRVQTIQETSSKGLGFTW